jgi:hypothetical protein
MMDTRPPIPLIVRTGVLSQEQFDALSPPEQAEVERTTADLCLRYGEDSMRRDRERHRYRAVSGGLSH